MNAYDEKRLRVIAALFIDYHRPGTRLLELSDIRDDYHVDISGQLYEGVIAGAPSLFEAYYSKDGPAAHLRAGGYGDVLRELLSWIDATTLDVDWQKEEIVTDASYGNRLPSRNGWKLLTIAKAENLTSVNSETPANSSIDWTKWGTIIGALALIATIIIAVVH